MKKFSLKNIFAPKKKKQQSRADLFVKIAGEFTNGVTKWVTIEDFENTRGCRKLIQLNGNTFPRSIRAKYGYEVETIYNHDNIFPKYDKRKAVAWRLVKV